MNRPDITVVIPVYNRGRLIRHTLQSVRIASSGITVETLVIDDGSIRPVSEDLAELGLGVTRVIRQENCGLLYARLAGLDAATGRNILFLDSDDLVSAEKLYAHVAALEAGADVTYTDQTGQVLDDATGPIGMPDSFDSLPSTGSAAEFFIKIQPAPHSPAFRTDYLRREVAAASFPPSHHYNPVAEIWFYHICSHRPARIAKCAGLALVGRHPGPRLTNNWERLGVASLAVQEAFARVTPTDTPEAREAWEYFAAKAFQSWRRLPRGFSPEFCARQLALYLRSPVRPSFAQLGGVLFQVASSALGPSTAGRLFKWRRASYATSRTMDDTAFASMLSEIPSP